jgi:NifB/MoaA-like Fe-S oxidoreductase
MALADMELTAGQQVVMKRLLERFGASNARLEAIRKEAQEELDAVTEYVAQVAEKLGIDVAKDYQFDIAIGKFRDRANITS